MNIDYWLNIGGLAMHDVLYIMNSIYVSMKNMLC